MSISTRLLFQPAFPRYDDLRLKKGKLRHRLEILGQVNNPRGSKRRVVFIEDRRVEKSSSAAARKCSHCRQVGHNSRTCQEYLDTSVPWRIVRTDKRDSGRAEDIYCSRCNNAGVVNCVFCERSCTSFPRDSVGNNNSEKPTSFDAFKERQLKTIGWQDQSGSMREM
ncbi:hypothetical protein GAYE_PCTG50G1212 [Galdieria yellowstonensis]|uniref:CCHC-type domain-containing protein n=1 Tax=Galdieria yellowstonensis TaxID=3028027 RepID=A0AAV9I6I0_9RHOD|nr:hypothetical protein GAYE_PCTG50G1212 [Galdieria yellowstonensis]